MKKIKKKYTLWSLHSSLEIESNTLLVMMKLFLTRLRNYVHQLISPDKRKITDEPEFLKAKFDT